MLAGRKKPKLNPSLLIYIKATFSHANRFKPILPCGVVREDIYLCGGGIMRAVFSDAFLTGHPDIDGEHRKIFEIINAVAGVIAKREYDMCQNLVASFLDLCRDHFTHEEKILKDLNFPRLKEHALFHASLLDKGEAIRAMCKDQNDPAQLDDCFTELVRFFIEDVVRGDLDFVSFLQDKGVVPQPPCGPFRPVN